MGYAVPFPKFGSHLRLPAVDEFFDVRAFKKKMCKNSKKAPCQMTAGISPKLNNNGHYHEFGNVTVTLIYRSYGMIQTKFFVYNE